MEKSLSYGTLVLLGIVGLLPSWRLGVIGDTSAQSRILKWSLHSMHQHGVVVAAHLGDVHYCLNPSVWRWKRSIMLRAVPRWIWVFGNHERTPCTGQRLVTWHRARRMWRKVWQPKPFLDVHGVRLIGVDTGSSWLTPGTTKHLAEALRGCRRAVLFMHRPPPVPYKLLSTHVPGRKGHWAYYSSLEPLPYRGRNRRLWKVLLRYRRRIQAIFHGHEHAYRHYYLGPFSVYISGGGGGRLHGPHDFYHWLIIDIHQARLKVHVVRYGRAQEK